MKIRSDNPIRLQNTFSQFQGLTLSSQVSPTTSISTENTYSVPERTHDSISVYTRSSVPVTNYDNDNELDSASLSESIIDHRLDMNDLEMLEEEHSQLNFDDVSFPNQRKHFFILSSAGKPVYAMNGTDEEIGGIMGIIQTVVGFFELEGSAVKSIVSGHTRFVFSNKHPLILVAISRIGESETELLHQLDLLHSYLLSSFTQPQITRLFEKKANFDLRAHLGKADLSCLDSLCKQMSTFNPGLLVGGLECLHMRKTVRERINQVLLSSKPHNLLYGLLLGPDNKLITILRPRKHTLHTTDLQLLFSLVSNQFSVDKEELWIPICFPKFNPRGFLYAYVRFLEGGNVLILMSAEKNAFFDMKNAGEKILAHSLHAVVGMDLVSVPDVYHYIYKSKRHVQYVSPKCNEEDSKLKLMLLYAKIHESAFSNGTPLNKSTLSFVQWDTAMGLAWITPTFELYVIGGPKSKRSTVLHGAKKIAKWCRKYEGRLFVSDGAVF